MCHWIDLEKALRKEKTNPDDICVVVSDIPSVTYYSETLTVDPAMSVGLRSSPQDWSAAVSYTNTKSEVQTR